jgi:hypothetical protein
MNVLQNKVVKRSIISIFSRWVKDTQGNVEIPHKAA